MKLLFIITIFIMPFSVANAQNNAELKQQFEELFQKNYENPKDVDAAFKYAEVAIMLKDYEAAISPLERILMFNPELDDVRTEIGILYYKLEAYKTAETYFNKALIGNNISEENKRRANIFLTKINTHLEKSL